MLARLALLLAAALAAAQAPDSFQVSGEHPLLLLRPQRLRLLRRERERQSPRWQQLEALIHGNAAMPEEGFAFALYHQVTGDAATGRRAIDWALGPHDDLRQLALVYDWCQDALSEKESAAIAAKLMAGIRSAPNSIAQARSQALAAVAAADRAPDASAQALERIVRQWWPASIAKPLRRGRNTVPRRDLYPLFEMLHAVRDNLGIDLREDVPEFFKELPSYDLISYYPASYPAAENEYRIPAVKGAVPDLNLAAMSRVAELAMVAFDNNAVQNQYLQGWAMHDRFVLHSPLGAPYEFLWANPYQPGLSYYNLPLLFHDRLLGRLFVRSNWDDDAAWLGYFDGQLQTFSNGEPKVLSLSAAAEPVQFGDTAVASGRRIRIAHPSRTVFVLGLAPSHPYDVEPDGEEMRDEKTDPGGILAIQFPYDFRGRILIREIGVSSTSRGS